MSDQLKQTLLAVIRSNAESIEYMQALLEDAHDLEGSLEDMKLWSAKYKTMVDLNEKARVEDVLSQVKQAIEILKSKVLSIFSVFLSNAEYAKNLGLFEI
uniref:Uncharacterized protein n=1 Tax=Glossina palpalis gambiensis TaxID=67801 RepID=A0A1B0BTE9_9MUSC